MSVQDDARENRMLDLFNLKQPAGRTRHGTDAILEIEGRTLEFELKSVTTEKGGLTTVRDFGPDHIAKWKNKHWLVSVYLRGSLVYCQYGSPAAMAPWIEEKWDYIKTDFGLAQHVPELLTLDTMYSMLGMKELYSLADAKKLHKKQYSKEKYVEAMDVSQVVNGKTKKVGYSQSGMLRILKDRARYVVERGSTLNNPHIPKTYFAAWEQIKENHAFRLRELVREWLDADEPQAHIPPLPLFDKP